MPSAQSSSGYGELLTSSAGLTQRTLYASYLANALKYRGQIPDTSYAVIKDQNVYELFKRDTVVMAAIQARKHMVAGTEWTCEPASEMPADGIAATLCTDLLERIENFDSARMNLSEAVFRGSAYAKIIGQRQFVALSDGIPRFYWVPTRIIDIDRRRVRKQLDRSIPAKPRWFTEVADAYDGAKWKEVGRTEKSWFIEHVYDDSEITLGYGAGLYDALYHYLFFKTVAMTEGLQGLQRWAQGWIVLSVDPERAGSTDRQNDDVVDQAVETINRHRGKHVLAGMKGDELKVENGGGPGHEIVMDFIRYCDDSMTRLILGSVLPSGGGEQGVGSGARADAEQDTTEMLVHFDRSLLEGTLTRSALALTFNLNRPLFEAAGAHGCSRPKFSLAPTTQPDVEAATTRVASLLDHQIPLKADEVYEQTGFTQPAPGDVTVGGPKPVAAPGAGPGGLPWAEAAAALDPETKATLGIPDMAEQKAQFDAAREETVRVVREEVAKFAAEMAPPAPVARVVPTPPDEFASWADAEAWYDQHSKALTVPEARSLNRDVRSRIRSSHVAAR